MKHATSTLHRQLSNYHLSGVLLLTSLFNFIRSFCDCKHQSSCCIAVIQIQLYTYTCRNIVNTTNETHYLRKIYLSHFIRNGCERVMSERWVGDWTNCNILTPSSFVFSSTSFSFCWAARSGVLGAHSPLLGAGSLYSILSPTNWTPGYIFVWHPPDSSGRHLCTQFNPSTVRVIPWYLRPDAPVLWSTAGSEVNMNKIGLLDEILLPRSINWSILSTVSDVHIHR